MMLAAQTTSPATTEPTAMPAIAPLERDEEVVAPACSDACDEVLVGDGVLLVRGAVEVASCDDKSDCLKLSWNMGAHNIDIVDDEPSETPTDTVAGNTYFP